MHTSLSYKILLIATLATLVGACGSSSSDGPADAPTNPAMRYLPWTVGSVWNYKLTDPQQPGTPKLDQPTTIMRMEDVGGVHAGTMALLVHHAQYTGSKDVWEAAVGELDVRYKTTFYNNGGTVTGTDIDQPYRLKLDESIARTTTGAAWSETFTETSTGGQPKSKTDQWVVVSDNEPITVIAGTFNALHVQRTSSGGIQNYWYVRGVGKVKDTGGGQDEELMSYTIAP